MAALHRGKLPARKADVLAAGYTLDPLPRKAIFAKALKRSARRTIAARAATFRDVPDDSLTPRYHPSAA